MFNGTILLKLLKVCAIQKLGETLLVKLYSRMRFAHCRSWYRSLLKFYIREWMWENHLTVLILILSRSILTSLLKVMGKCWMKYVQLRLSTQFPGGSEGCQGEENWWGFPDFPSKCICVRCEMGNKRQYSCAIYWRLRNSLHRGKFVGSLPSSLSIGLLTVIVNIGPSCGKKSEGWLTWDTKFSNSFLATVFVAIWLKLCTSLHICVTIKLSSQGWKFYLSFFTYQLTQFMWIIHKFVLQWTRFAQTILFYSFFFFVVKRYLTERINIHEW